MSEPRPTEPPSSEPPSHQPERKDERAFAIDAPRDRIWNALLKEVRDGVESGVATILREERPRLLELDVQVARGLGIRYCYTLTVDVSHTEVAVRVYPYGIRFAIGNIMSLGRGRTSYMLAATQGLANLKASVEDGLPGDANGE